MHICAAHQLRVLVFDHGTYHSIDGHLCTSAYIVTPSGPRPAETLRAQAQLAEAVSAT